MADTKKKRPASKELQARRRAAAEAKRKRQARQRLLIVAAAALALVVLVAILVISRGGGTSIEGVTTYRGKGREHVSTPVDYPEVPPVGGDHSPIPQTCGAYGEPVPNEQAVHSMEHGAVWITHRPDLPSDQVERLRDLTDQSHVLVSPFPGLPAPVVASAWQRQIRLESASDPRLEDFISEFRNGPQTPEPGAACAGTGSPLR
jgi:hypothetical protein